MIFVLNAVLICVEICLLVDGAPVNPSGHVQYVFNVPTELQGGNQHALQTAITNLQQQVTILSKRLQVLESNGTAKIDLTSGNIGSSSSSSSSHGTGVHYTHWGKKECNDQASLIYSGYMAKTYYVSKGGGIDYQCLPMDPEYTEHTVAGQQGNTYIYGVEIWAQGVDGVHQSKENHNDVTCSVCETRIKTQVLMVPAKLTCPNGWHRQYQGFLMAERYSHSVSTFVCVDKDVEYIDSGIGNENSGYVVPVEGGCGSLPCPRYEPGRELTCVVCTK